jgi:hypothetical protein
LKLTSQYKRNARHNYFIDKGIEDETKFTHLDMSTIINVPLRS